MQVMRADLDASFLPVHRKIAHSANEATNSIVVNRARTRAGSQETDAPDLLRALGATQSSSAKRSDHESAEDQSALGHHFLLQEFDRTGEGCRTACRR